MKVKILICTGLMLNDHSNPYIESTTVLSDTNIIILCLYQVRRKQVLVSQEA